MGKLNLPKLSTKIQQRRMLFPGHNYRNSELVQVASQLVLWQPAHGRKTGEDSEKRFFTSQPANSLGPLSARQRNAI